MTAAQVTDFFLTLCERADNNVTVAVDALAAGEALGIHAPTVFAHVNELVQCYGSDTVSSVTLGLIAALAIADGTQEPRGRWRGVTMVARILAPHPTRRHPRDGLIVQVALGPGAGAGVIVEIAPGVPLAICGGNVLRASFRESQRPV